MATLLPFANLRFAPFSISRTWGNSLRMNSIEPSVDPLSETMTSKSVECVEAQMDRRQSEMTLRSFQHKITMDNFKSDILLKSLIYSRRQSSRLRARIQ